MSASADAVGDLCARALAHVLDVRDEGRRAARIDSILDAVSRGAAGGTAEEVSAMLDLLARHWIELRRGRYNESGDAMRYAAFLAPLHESIRERMLVYLEGIDRDYGARVRICAERVHQAQAEALLGLARAEEESPRTVSSAVGLRHERKRAAGGVS